jgi:hypothetical protein
MESLFLLDSALKLNRARILNLLETRDFVVTNTIDMNTLVLIEVSASHIAIERHQVGVGVIHRLDHIKFIRDQVGVLGTPIQQLYLLHCHESGQVINFGLGVVAI